jgi:5'-AMP-activated protein kinase regulatory gamma subunit
MGEASGLAAMLQERDLFDLLPAHGKVVTLDADLPMKHALDALASHAATCLPVWDSHQQRFVDVFTCTDLIDIVLFTHRALAQSGQLPAAAGGGCSSSVEGGSSCESGGGQRGEAQQAIERCQLRDLHGLKRSKPAGFVMASVDDSLYTGCLMLKQHGLECLPLGESASTTSLLHLLLPEQLLAFIVASPDLQRAAPQLFLAPLELAVLPNCAPPRTIFPNTTLADALQLLSERQLRALPVVNQNGSLVDVLSARDVRHLASHSHTDDLTTRVEDAIALLPAHPTRLHTCTPSDSLGSAIQRLANADVAQLICVDPNGAVCGIVTSSDLLTCFLEPPGAPQPMAQMPQQQVPVQ